MKYFIYLLKRALKSTVVMTALILILWITLYKLTDWATLIKYLEMGIAVCLFNTWLDNFRKRQIQNVMHVQANWVALAGAVLVLYYAGFAPAAVLLAAATFALPFFGATIYDAVVGLSLLITLALLMA